MLYHPFFNFNDFFGHYTNTFCKFYKTLGHIYLKLLHPEEVHFVLDPLRIYQPLAEAMLQAFYNPEPLFKRQNEFLEEYNKLITYLIEFAQGKKPKPICEPDTKDKRFTHQDWQENLFFNFLKQYYLIAARHIEHFFKKAPYADKETKEKAIFTIKQIMNMLSPSNFISTNPEIVESIFKD